MLLLPLIQDAMAAGKWQFESEIAWVWGGVGGRPWDNRAFSSIKQVVITRDKDAIYSIAAEYIEMNGKTVVSPEYGRSGSKFRDQIKFEDSERKYGPVVDSSGFEVIKSLTFHTNEGKYGPLGKEIGKFFSEVGK